MYAHGRSGYGLLVGSTLWFLSTTKNSLLMVLAAGRLHRIPNEHIWLANDFLSQPWCHD